MRKLLCATGNESKFGVAKAVLAKYGIELQQIVIDIDEIQGEEGLKVVEHKAWAAYNIVQKPVVVTDDCWNIPALKGFPGPYMKSINHWFEPKDFLSLAVGLDDRTILLEQFVAYCDGHEVACFRKDIPGKILKAARGIFGPPIMKVVSLDDDGNRSIAETFDQAKQHQADRLESHGQAWAELGKWLQERAS